VTLGPVPVSEQALARLVALVRDEIGNVVPRARHGFLEEIAARRARARGFADGDSYAAALAAGLPGEWEHLVPLVTVKESYFFRAPQQFASIERRVLPRLLAARGADRGERRLRIWCAAAARGEEPATLALILAEHEALASWDWRIVATDLDTDALAAAERGLYGERAVSQVPARVLGRWFSRRGSLYELHREIRDRIDYLPLNLARPPYRELDRIGGMDRGPFDLVLLRNVLIYFRRSLQRRVMTEVGNRLASDGYLFLGASETLWQIYDRLDAVEMEQCYAYRHPEAPRSPREAPPKGAAPAPARRWPPVPKPEEPRTRRPGAEELAAEPVIADEVPPTPPAERPSPPGGQRRGAHEILLEAARELAANRVDAAAERVARAREADPSEPSAYALEGFLHDLGSRPREAAAAYRAALYLDPGLFQPRLLLADCLRRLGEDDRAAHEYRQVLATLDRGTARELVLFEDLPFPNRERARKLCRRALGGRGG
jgi:chemotaxis protein methyltransferase CheR